MKNLNALKIRKKLFFFNRCYCSRVPDSCYDAVIVGGGHNGLVAAAYLAKNGLKTCVLEKREVLGGAAVTEEIIKGYKFSRASYLLSLLRPQIYRDLNLKKYGLKYFLRNPSSFTPLKKSLWSTKTKSLILGMNTQLNFDQISKFSRQDAENYVKYERKLEKLVDCIQPLMDVSPSSIAQILDKDISAFDKVKIMKSSDMRNAFFGIIKLMACLPFAYEMMFTSAVDIMNKWFDTEPLKATLMTDACIGSTLSPAEIGSSYVLMHHVMGGIDNHKGAWVYPEGGMGTVSRAIANCALDHGAHIFTNNEVIEIKLDDRNEVEGVLTQNNIYIKCKKILSNGTPQRTFLNLLPAEVLPEKFKNMIEHINYKSPVTKINVALNKIPNFICDPNKNGNSVMPHHQCSIHLNCESVNNILSSYEEGMGGVLPKKPFIEMTIPSSLDSSICPQSHHVCLLFTQYTLYTLKERIWDEETRKEYANIVFDSIEEYAPGFRESIVGYEILTPPDLEEIFDLTGGHIFHGELSLNQLFFNRPVNWSELSPHTPISGLYLCGSGAHPGGGVTGSPGRLAALAVISDISK